MKFCEKCGNLLSPKKEDGTQVWYCITCNKTFKMKNENLKLSQKSMESSANKIVVVKENKESLPITSKECPKCNNKEVYWWTMQTRSSDEPETRFYKCTKCSHTWREYS